MPTILLLTNRGERVEQFYGPGEEVPAVGEVVQLGRGRTGTRVHAGCNGIVKSDRRHVSRQLPRWYKPHKEAGGTFDVTGRCQFEGKRQVSETERAIADSVDEKHVLGYDKD